MKTQQQVDDIAPRSGEFDLSDIAQFIRDDIAEAVDRGALPQRSYCVRLARRKYPEIRIFTDSFEMELRETLAQIAKQHVRMVWNPRFQAMGPNFKPVIRIGGAE